MSQMQIDQVLAQIRALSAQTAPQASAPSASAPGGVSEFAALLKSGIDDVNKTEQKASTLADQFERGTPGVDLPQVMVEMQKASVSFRALTEVRNRLVSAYQDIMNMQM
ncbi:MAG TPA: flagellar hook-basal body complex protein FliE [Steroidobacteraceae bacterium]|nr:flagellar hook-basal body complex protein FliE [Steroidobacteraceae bacterium]